MQFIKLATMLFFAWIVSGCAAAELTPAQLKARELCYGQAAARYQMRALECESDECIEAEVPRWKEEQEACP